jgi:hypothetical protein
MWWLYNFCSDDFNLGATWACLNIFCVRR